MAVPLTLSRQTQFELQASVYTQGFSENPGLCSVRISVTRNLNPPVFTNTLLRFTVFEYEPIGYQITQLTASDADNDTIRYYLSGNAVIQQYFMVDSVTGRLMVRIPLYQNTLNTYQVCTSLSVSVVCLPACLLVFLSVCLSIYLQAYLLVCLSLCLYICL